MADSNHLGALVNPMGHAEALSKSEYETIQKCLEMYRSDDPELKAIADMIYYGSGQENCGFQAMMNFLTGNLESEDWRDVDGLLVGNGAPIRLYQETVTAWTEDDLSKADREYKRSEAGTLAAFVKVLRAGGWFPDWLDLQIHNFVPGNNPMPSPLEVMGSLTVALKRFQEKVEETREMLQLYPDEFQAASTVDKSPAAAEPQEPPKPASVEYTLTMIKDSSHEDSADMTRAEFQALKRHLATMRAKKPARRKKAA